MSLAMATASVRQGAPEGTATIQKLLDENSQLLNRIKELQAAGKVEEATPHQQLLHRNLLFLAKVADQSLLPQLQPDNPSPAAETPATAAVASAAHPPQSGVQPPQPQPQQQPQPPQMPPQMSMPPQMGMPQMPPQQHYGYPPQGMPPHGYPGQPQYDPQQQMPPGGAPMGYMQPR